MVVLVEELGKENFEDEIHLRGVGCNTPYYMVLEKNDFQLFLKDLGWSREPKK